MTARTAEEPAPLNRRWALAAAAVRRLEWVALAVITLVPIGLVLYAARHGLNVTPDSVGYVAAARSFASSGSFIYWDGTPFTHWPFGYPLLLSLPLALGLTPESAATAINVVALAALVLATYAVARQALGSSLLGLAAAGFTGVAGDTLRDEISLLTEPLFLVACLAVIVGLGLIARGGLSWPRILVVVACASAGELLRYIGISLVPVIGLSILVIEWRRGWLRAGLVAAGVASLSALGTVVVALHNLLTIGSLTGSFGPSQATPVSLGKIALTVFGQWLLPTVPGTTLPLVLGAALVGLGVIGSVALLRERGLMAVPLVAFAGLYPAALLGSELRVDGYLDARYLSPLLPVAAVLVVAAIRAAWRRSIRLDLLALAGSRPITPIGAVTAGAMALAIAVVLGTNAYASITFLRTTAHRGMGYDSVAARSSALTAEVARLRETMAVLSNDPARIYWRAGGRIELSQAALTMEGGASAARAMVAAGELTTYAKFDNPRTGQGFSPADVRSWGVVLTDPQPFADGTLYRLGLAAAP